MSFSLSLTNKEVWEFYDEHKNLDFENTNLLFVRILKQVMQDANPTMNTNMVSQLLENIKTLQNDVASMNNSFSKTQQDMNTTFSMKFMEFKREYVEDLKMILTNNTSEKVAPILKTFNDTLLDKTRIMINEIIPKNQEHLYSNIEKSINGLYSSINQDTNSLMKTSINKENLDQFISTLDEKFSKTLVHSQNMFNAIITSSEHRLQAKLGEIKDLSSTNSSANNQLQNNVNELLRKMENSSSKGKISENLLYNILNPLYPTAQIDSVGTVKETGDIIMTRKDKPSILFENKNYDKNVGQEEVRKFLRDVENQNCSGIMLAQHFGIVNKDNFEIEIHNNNVLVYLHKVEYDADKIKAAVDIIDHFKSTLVDMESDNGDSIQLSKELLDDINKDYQGFVANKLSHIKTIKDYNQKLLAQVDDIKIPSLEHYLSKIYASSASKEDICEFCNYVAKNQRALTAHYRGCALKKNHKNNVTVDPIQNVLTPKK
jgi:hypothetical protein